MNTDLRRRAVLVGVGTALTGTLAGCSGDDGAEPTGDGADGTTAEDTEMGENGSGGTEMDEATTTATDDGSSTATATESTTPAKGPRGSVRTNRIDGIEFVGWRSEARDHGIFAIDTVVNNGGDEAVDVENYTWDVLPYAEDGTEITVSAAGPPLPEYDGFLEPGRTGTVYYELRVDDPAAVASYEIYLSCEGVSADGEYCPE